MSTGYEEEDDLTCTLCGCKNSSVREHSFTVDRTCYDGVHYRDDIRTVTLCSICAADIYKSVCMLLAKKVFGVMGDFQQKLIVDRSAISVLVNIIDN